MNTQTASDAHPQGSALGRRPGDRRIRVSRRERGARARLASAMRRLLHVREA